MFSVACSQGPCRLEKVRRMPSSAAVVIAAWPEARRSLSKNASSCLPLVSRAHLGAACCWVPSCSGALTGSAGTPGASEVLDTAAGLALWPLLGTASPHFAAGGLRRAAESRAAGLSPGCWGATGAPCSASSAAALPFTEAGELRTASPAQKAGAHWDCAQDMAASYIERLGRRSNLKGRTARELHCL